MPGPPFFVWAETSETGVMTVAPEHVQRKGRLAPGKLFLVDLEEGRIVEDEEVKRRIARRQPTSASPSSSQPSSQASATASAWAGSFCGYAQAWKTSLQHASARLKTSHSPGTATVALNTAKSATLLFSNQLSVLGAPPGAGAQQATHQLRLYGQRLKYSNQNLQGEFNASSSTTSELTQKIRNVRGTLLVMVGQLQQAYGYIATLHGSSQLKQALTSNSTCRVVFSKT